MSFLPSIFSSHSPAHMLRDLEKSYERMLRDWPFNGQISRALSLDVEEQKDRYVVTADLPGVAKENVEISYQDGNLTIQSRENKETEKKDKSYLVKERSSSYSMRSLALPFGDPSKEITAELKEGVLTVVVPKAETNQGKKITVK